jgi:hypothetical protein
MNRFQKALQFGEIIGLERLAVTRREQPNHYRTLQKRAWITVVSALVKVIE